MSLRSTGDWGEALTVTDLRKGKTDSITTRPWSIRLHSWIRGSPRQATATAQIQAHDPLCRSVPGRRRTPPFSGSCREWRCPCGSCLPAPWRSSGAGCWHAAVAERRARHEGHVLGDGFSSSLALSMCSGSVTQMNMPPSGLVQRRWPGIPSGWRPACSCPARGRSRARWAGALPGSRPDDLVHGHLRQRACRSVACLALHQLVDDGAAAMKQAQAGASTFENVPSRMTLAPYSAASVKRPGCGSPA